MDIEPIEAVVTFPINIWVHMNILFIIKVKILMLITWSYYPLPHFSLCW